MNFLLNDKDFNERSPDGQMEILRIRNTLIYTPAIVNIHLNRDRAFFLTNLLEARAQRLVLGIGLNELQGNSEAGEETQRGATQYSPYRE